jgi:hypothetical protein
VIWHVQELDGLFRKREAEALKSFFSLVESEIRLPFGIGMTPCRTMASFCGSTNTFEFLSDPTGNRRFLTLNIEDCLVDKEDLEQVRDPSKICLNDLDLRQVYAEARHRVEAGERIYFSKTEAKSFAQYTDIFRYKSAILEEFESRVAVGNPSEDRFYGLQELRNTLNLSGLSNLSDRELFKLDMDMKGWLNKHGAVLKVVSKIKKYCVKILPSAAASHSLDERMRGLLTGKGGAAVVPPGAELVTPAAVRAEDLT